MDIILAIAASAHLGLAGDYNEIHPSIQARFDNGIIAGAYYNSESAVSVYAGLRGEWGDWFAEGGAVAGYQYANVLPYGRAGYQITDSLSVFIAPAFEAWGDDVTIGAVIGAEYSFSLKGANND